MTFSLPSTSSLLKLPTYTPLGYTCTFTLKEQLVRNLKMKVFSSQKDPRVQMHGKMTARIWKNIPTGISTMLIRATRAVKFVFLRRENLHCV